MEYGYDEDILNGEDELEVTDYDDNIDLCSYGYCVIEEDE